ncbi:MAG: hypothetical protein ACR2I2_15190 [Bryobacteraceae bacterium]
MAAPKKTKKCLIVGEADSEATRRKVKGIVERAVAKGYKTEHAHDIAGGMYMDAVIKRLGDDDLVIADLTPGDPQVYYLMAIRHAIEKPIISLCTTDTDLPIESTGLTVIRINVSEEFASQEKIEKHVRAINEPGYKVTTPISQALTRNIFFDRATEEEKRVGQFFDSINTKINSRLDELERLTRQIEDSTRKPLHGIEEVFAQVYRTLEDAKVGGRIWFVGMTFGLGPPHRYRIRKLPVDVAARQRRPGASPEKLEKSTITIDDLIHAKWKELPLFDKMIDRLHERLGEIIEHAKDPVLVCLTHDKKALMENFLSKLSRRSSYSSLATQVDVVADEIIRLHKAVEKKVTESKPVTYVNSIPLQILIVEKGGPSPLVMGKKACVVFHVGTANIETYLLEDGETGFYTEVESLVEMFEQMAESLWDAGRPAEIQPASSMSN